MHRRQFLNRSLALAASSVLPLPLLAAGSRTRIEADVSAVSLDGAAVTLPKGVVKDFVEAMRGPVMLPGHAHYDVARLVWNGMFDRKPALIAQCSGPADVISAVKFARDLRAQ